MRIALVIYGSLESASGGYLYDRKVVEHLRARGHTVETVSLPWRTYRRHLTDNLSSEVVRRLTSLEVDVILEDESNHPSLVRANRAIRKRGGPPLVAIVHHLRTSEDHPAWKRPFHRSVERAFLRSIDAVICNSHTTLETVRRLAGPPAHSCVVPPAGDHLGCRTYVSLHEAEGRTGPLSLLFVGNIIPRKGLHTILEAMTLTDYACHLTVVGTDKADPNYARLMRRVALETGKPVAWVGFLDDAALCDAYNACDLFVLPSYEGFGIVYLEAMRRGRPVVASTKGAAHELVVEGVTGFLVPPGDADAVAACIDQLAADRRLLATMGEAARTRSLGYPTWAEAVAQIETFLAELVQR